MQQVQITFRDIPPSDPVRDYVTKHTQKLDTFHPRITSCHVALECPHRHRLHGKDYRVRVDVKIPGHEVVVQRDPGDDIRHQDLYAAIDEVFDEAGRLLLEQSRMDRQQVKHHEPARRRGRVKKIFHYEGFGFLETPEGDEVYFHRNSVLHGAFQRLAIGSEVRFVEEDGDKGPQASSVVT